MPSPAGRAGGGHALAEPTREALESSFGVDLRSVRLHTGPQAEQANVNLSARAFTYGPQIFLGRSERPTDVGLLAHEVTHVVQQHGAQTIQRACGCISCGCEDAAEREACRVSDAVLRGEPVTVRERVTTPRVQRLGLSDVLDYFADKANIIPGFRMFTILLGVNPINMSRVERSAANILRAVIEFIPGGGLITQALDNYGIFDKIGNWVDEQIRTLGISLGGIKTAISNFLDSLSWSDIFHLGDVWDRAKRIFTDPIDRIITFAKNLVSGIIGFIKDAILMPLARLAAQTRGWDLLIAILGKNPITGETVPRNADTLIGGFMKLIGQEEAWENMKKANAVARAWAWFQTAMTELLGFVQEIPSLFLAAFRSLELVDIILVPRALAKVAGVFGGFLVRFIKWAGNALWNLLEIIFSVVAPGAMPYLKRAMAAFRTILKNPVGFVGNLVKAGKLGFQQFSDRIGTHLKNALIEWLTGTLTGVYLPKSLDFPEIVKFVLSVLGLSWQNIRQKLVRMVGETAVKTMETGFQLVMTLVTQGPAAAWEQIKTSLGNLRDMALQAITDYVVTEVVKKAVAKIISLLVPGGAFIQAIITIYDTIMVFVSKLKTIIQVAMAFIDSMVAIANGQIGPAAKKVESVMAGLLVLVISFLAGFAGLGKIADKVMNVLKTKVLGPIDKALDKVADWIVATAKKLFAKAFGKKEDGKKTAEVKEPFSMGPEGHTLTGRLKGGSVEISMASDADLVLSGLLSKAISEVESDKNRQASQIRAITGELTAIKFLVDQIRPDYERAGKPEAFDQFIKPRMAKIIGRISGLAKYDPPITSLQHIISVGKPRFIPRGYKIRPNLYDRATKGQWKTLSEKLRAAHVSKLGAKYFAIWKLRDDPSDPGNAAKARSQWDAGLAAKEIPEDKAPTFATYDHPKHFPTFEYATDHIKSLGNFWNAGEKNKDDAARSATTLDTSNLQVLTRKENERKSGVDFDRDVGPKFSSVVANSPENSRTIDGQPFEDH